MKSRTRSIKIFLPLVLLLLIGVVMVYDASVAEAQSLFGDKFYFVKRHLAWVGGGLVITSLMAKIPTSLIKKLSLFGFLVSIGMLIWLIIPGFGAVIRGAKRWIYIGNSIYFQPSELTKLTTVIYLASWLQKKKKIINVFLLLGILVGLLMLQPDMGTAMVILATGLVMFYVSGISWLQVTLSAVATAAVGLILVIISPYRLERWRTFINPIQDLQGRSYHINQVLLALGSGGLFGLGLGRSRQKFQYLPEASTDSIFAVIGEELGFLGSTAIIILFLVLFYQLFLMIIREPDGYRRMLAAGLLGWISIQTLINLSAMVSLVPLTGVPLPFISYGGSSLIVQMISMGILLRISLTQK